jgi:hypothetical protein
MLTRILAVCFFVGAAAIPMSAHADFVLNGSLEDESQLFVETSFNYMKLFANDTSIAEWTVTPGTEQDIAWGKSPTGDSSFYAADGTFFVDLSGYGANSPNGGIQQRLSGLVVGQTYSFSLASVGALPDVTIGGVAVTLSAGTSFTVGGTTTWTPEFGTFVADSTDPLLLIKNPNDVTGGITFVDNISITARDQSPIPEPTTLVLLGLALAGLGFTRRKQ